ncbi:MAG: UDP-N-acetylglucosamine--N-acetylmuramyl-(pentapeptide) pyrophosphoryl-undecaprenol N-acetylglucosamine transferase [Microgenomates group bacterium LiPW_16]|nr:MAG: UDP-N-acetylglucosamine--N-acetylmuramyl-(pentapeptide) pyrophosphoryl-undecaprenol N-acetylglucosamine transferase [Microgenomates group bacterium LiPW_16]
MFSPKTNKIVITGGHLTPALAAIAELKKEGWEILFIGRKHALEGDPSLSVEYRVIKELGISFVPLTAGRFQRSFTRYTILSLLKVPLGFIQSLYWVARFKPNLILSFGGYLALPVALSGWILGIPILTHEQSVIPGLATKIIARFARRVCVSWPQTTEHFPKEKVVLTGNPIREEVLKKYQVSSIKYQVSNEDLPLIYITGGSLGCRPNFTQALRKIPDYSSMWRLAGL